MNCQTCTNPTKHPIGFWDGEKSHGQIFNCDNQACIIKQENIEKALAIEEEKRKNSIENTRNKVFMELVKSRRLSLGITIAKMARELSITPSAYSNYETCREPLPVELRDRVEGVFEEQKGGYMGEILRKYGRNK